MQRFKEELQDIAKSLDEVALVSVTTKEHETLKDIASRIRNAGSLITHDDRICDAKKMALEAYEDFTMLIEEGVFHIVGTD